MRKGIPQGSALCPLLFLIYVTYVNGLPSQVPGGLLLWYADNTTLICSAPDATDGAELMNFHLEVISQWTTANRMRLNLSTVNLLLCGTEFQVSTGPHIFLRCWWQLPYRAKV